MTIEEWVSRAVAFKREKDDKAGRTELKRFQRFLGKQIAAELEVKQSSDKVYFEYHKRRFTVRMLGGWALVVEDTERRFPRQQICTSLEDFLLFLASVDEVGG